MMRSPDAYALAVSVLRKEGIGTVTEQDLGTPPVRICELRLSVPHAEAATAIAHLQTLAIPIGGYVTSLTHADHCRIGVLVSLDLPAEGRAA